MNGGVQNRLAAAFLPIHINQVVWCELAPKERRDEIHEAGGTVPWPVCLGKQ